MKKRVLSLLIALLCLLFAQAQAANTCSHPVDQREPTMVQYSRTVGGVRQLVQGAGGLRPLHHQTRRKAHLHGARPLRHLRRYRDSRHGA